MSEILFQYEKVSPISWAYLSSLLIVALYFKFNRFWSVRNLDLILLILLAPGLLLVHFGLKMMRDSRQELAAVERAVKDGTFPRSSDEEPATELPAPAPDEGADEEEGPKPGNESATETAAAAQQPTTKVLEKALENGKNVTFSGYAWLFAVGALLVVRLLFDPTMVRRPLLEPNLSTGGLLFIGCALFVFLMANVVTSNVTASDIKGVQGAEALLHRTDNATKGEKVEDYSQYGPGYFAFHLIPSVITTPFARTSDAADPQMAAHVAVAKTMAILSHLAVLAAMILIGYLHFENIKMGIGAATLYLMLPYTAQMTGHVDHVLPSALLLWAIVLYRQPMAAGALIGLAMSVFYYPFFLLPLWLSFYWQRGVGRFASGLLITVGLMVLTLVFVSEDVSSFFSKIRPMFGLWFPKIEREGLRGIWAVGWDPVFRITVIAGCAAMAGILAVWPAQKNLGTLLSCTAAVMIAVQFWHAHGVGGGMYMAWFLPLTLLTIFRPNLEDRVALTVLAEDWLSRRRPRAA